MTLKEQGEQTGVRSLVALKPLAAFAVICAAVVILAQPGERRETRADTREQIRPQPPLPFRSRFRPAITVPACVAFLAILATSLSLGTLTEKDGPADSRLGHAAAVVAFSRSGQNEPASYPALSNPGGSLSAEVNAHWFQRARLIEIKYKLGGIFVRQIMQESRFADDVIYGQRSSWAGAEGIAQIMREYHPWVDPLKPEAALDYAARHMLDLLLRFDGDVVKALAAYNAGAGTVLWAVEFAGNDWFAWVPWETQEYIASIMLPGEQGLLPNWGQVKQWWSRTAERIERPLQLRLLQGRTIAIGALPEPAPPADAAVAEAVPPVSP
jgi:Transglycosylase SLT domain